jgi:hypothetical protein
LGFRNAQRLALVSLVVAIKFAETQYYSNQDYASLCCIELKEFNEMEKVFLQMIDYELYSTGEAISEYQQDMHDMFGPLTDHSTDESDEEIPTPVFQNNLAINNE